MTNSSLDSCFSKIHHTFPQSKSIYLYIDIQRLDCKPCLFWDLSVWFPSSVSDLCPNEKETARDVKEKAIKHCYHLLCRSSLTRDINWLHESHLYSDVLSLIWGNSVSLMCWCFFFFSSCREFNVRQVVSWLSHSVLLPGLKYVSVGHPGDDW